MTGRSAHPTRRGALLGLAIGSSAISRTIPAAWAATGPVPVTATFTILADLVRQVGGDAVQVATVIGPDSEAHAFQPSPADARKIADAALVVANGLGLEGWIDRLIGSRPGRLVVASTGIVPRRLGRAPDPHAWQAVPNAKRYVENIRDGLARLPGLDRPALAERAARYGAELDALDREVRAAIAAIPPERRLAVTNHDAFGYFADAYGLRLVPLQGISQEGEVSARAIAAVVRQIKAERIPALFLENVADPRLADRIAAETGARIGGELYSDALSKPDGPAPTYIAMVRHNVRTIAAALAP